MADEEDENLPKAKKEKEKDTGLPELAPGDVINPIEYKMFDPANMQKTLSVPQRTVYSFQKELAGTLHKRLDGIRIKLGTDDSHPVTERRATMELTAGLQPWEDIDPVTGQLLELRAPFGHDVAQAIIEKASTHKATTFAGGMMAASNLLLAGTKQHGANLPTISPSVMVAMRGALPKAKVEDKNAMPAVNRRNAATPKVFEGLLRAKAHAEYGDYYETIEKVDRLWRETIGKRMSEVKPVEKKLEVLKGKEMLQKKRLSVAPQQLDMGTDRLEPRSTGTTATLKPYVAPPAKKSQAAQRRPPGVPAILDGLIDYFTDAISPDCNLETWLTPISTQPVFKIRDIPADVENTVVTIARVSHSKFIDDRGIAMQIRLALEKYHGYACKWHVIVGRKFGLQVNSDRGNFLFMYLGHLGYVVFRTFG